MTMRRQGPILALGVLLGIAAACGSSSSDDVGVTTNPNTGGSPDAGTSSDNTETGSDDVNTPTPDDSGADNQFDGNPGFCPEGPPAEGAECMTPFPASCSYDDGGCVCNEGAWKCYSDADCPATAPDQGATCDLNGMECGYDDNVNCYCDDADGWGCQAPCPQAQPTDGDSCVRPVNSSCNYAGGSIVQGGGFGNANNQGMPDTNCACSDGAFACFTQDDCPTAPPSSGESCDVPTLNCEFEGGNCACDGDGSWNCFFDCPETFPDDGAACDRPEQAVCRYGEGTLVQGGGMFGGGNQGSDSACSCSDLKFDCISEEDCPASAPSSADECAGLNGLACDYGDLSCACGNMGWNCQSACPAAPPETGDSCARSPNQPCRYGEGALLMGGGMMNNAAADNTCTCIEEAYSCFTAEDCPAATPEAGSACEQPGLFCAIDDQNCFCSTNSNSWTCFMPMTPPDNGAGGQSNTAGAGGEGGSGGQDAEPAAGAGGEGGAGGTGGSPAAGAGGESPVGGMGGESAGAGAGGTGE